MLQVGPLAVKEDLFYILIGGLAAFAWMAVLHRRTAYRSAPIVDIFGTAALIVLVAWKLTPVLFEPSILWERPMLLLVGTGSVYGLLIGLAAAVVYAIVRIHKGLKLPLRYAGDLAVLGVAVWWGCVLLLAKPVPFKLLYAVILLGIAAYLSSSFSKKAGTGYAMRRVLAGGGALVLVVSIFDEKGPLLWGLAQHQWIYGLLMFAGLLLPESAGKRADREWDGEVS